MKTYIELNEDEMDEILSLILNRFEICSILNNLDHNLRSLVKYDKKCFDGDKIESIEDICSYVRKNIYEIQELMKNN